MHYTPCIATHTIREKDRARVGLSDPVSDTYSIIMVIAANSKIRVICTLMVTVSNERQRMLERKAKSAALVTGMKSGRNSLVSAKKCHPVNYSG